LTDFFPVSSVYAIAPVSGSCKKDAIVMASVVVKAAVALGVAVAIGYPIRQEISARAAIQHNMINSLDANDAAALRQWQGSAESFIVLLYDRCMRAHSGDEQACTRYRE
jgi:hypothetical protein